MIDELKQLYEKSTQGEWECCLGSGNHVCTGIHAYQKEGGSVFIADCMPDYALDMNPHGFDHRPNMNFIAAMHNAFPELIELAELGLAFKKRREETLKMLFDEKE